MSRKISAVPVFEVDGDHGDGTPVGVELGVPVIGLVDGNFVGVTWTRAMAVTQARGDETARILRTKEVPVTVSDMERRRCTKME